MMKRLQTGLILVALLALCAVMASAEVVFEENFEVIPAGVSETEALQLYPFGWIPSGGADVWSVRLSNAMPYTGKYSMEVLVDPGNTRGILISSRPIPVEEGKEYTVSAMIYNVPGDPYGRKTDLYLEFWPEGGWWGDTDFWSVENWRALRNGAWSTRSRLHHAANSGPVGSWSEVSVTAVAPAGAKYATISFWTSSRVVKSYIDDVRMEVR